MVSKYLIVLLITFLANQRTSAFEWAWPRSYFSKDSSYILTVDLDLKEFYRKKKTLGIPWNITYSKKDLSKTLIGPLDEPQVIFDLKDVFADNFFVSESGNYVILIDTDEFLTKRYQRASIRIYSKENNQWTSWKFKDLKQFERLSKITSFFIAGAWFNSLSFIEEKYIVLTINKSKRKTTQLYINLEIMKLSKQKL